MIYSITWILDYLESDYSSCFWQAKMFFPKFPFTRNVSASVSGIVYGNANAENRSILYNWTNIMILEDTSPFCWASDTPVLEAVNTVCLGFSDEFIEFSQSWFYRWFLAKITDFGGKDEGFLAKITKDYRFFGEDYRFFRRISLSLPMSVLNERGTCTCLHWGRHTNDTAHVQMLGMCRHANEGKSTDWLNSINSSLKPKQTVFTHCFGLLVTFPLGFKARIGSLIRA